MRRWTCRPHVALTWAAPNAVGFQTERRTSIGAQKHGVHKFVFVSSSLRRTHETEAVLLILEREPLFLWLKSSMHQKTKRTWGQTLAFNPVWLMFSKSVKLMGLGLGQIHHFDRRSLDEHLRCGVVRAQLGREITPTAFSSQWYFSGHPVSSQHRAPKGRQRGGEQCQYICSFRIVLHGPKPSLSLTVFWTEILVAEHGFSPSDSLFNWRLITQSNCHLLVAHARCTCTIPSKCSQPATSSDFSLHRSSVRVVIIATVRSQVRVTHKWWQQLRAC